MMRTETTHFDAVTQSRPSGRKDSAQRNNVQGARLWRAARRSAGAGRRARNSRSDHPPGISGCASRVTGWPHSADTPISSRNATVFVGAGRGAHRSWRKRKNGGGARAFGRNRLSREALPRVPGHVPYSGISRRTDVRFIGGKTDGRRSAAGRRRTDNRKTFRARGARAHDREERAARCEVDRRIALLFPLFSGQKEKELIRKAQSRAHPSRLRVKRLPREKLRHQLSLSPVSTRCCSLLPFFLRRFFFF